MDKHSQLLRGSASDELIAETRCFAFDSLLYGKPEQLFKKRFAVFCSTKTQHSLYLFFSFSFFSFFLPLYLLLAVLLIFLNRIVLLFMRSGVGGCKSIG